MGPAVGLVLDSQKSFTRRQTGARIQEESWCLATGGTAHKTSLELLFNCMKNNKARRANVLLPAKISQQSFGSCSITQKIHSSFLPSYWQLTRPLISQVTFSVNTSMTVFPVAAQPSDRLQPCWRLLNWDYRETLALDICVLIKAFFGKAMLSLAQLQNWNHQNGCQKPTLVSHLCCSISNALLSFLMM